MIDAFSVFTDFEPFYSLPEPSNSFNDNYSTPHLSIVSFRQQIRAACKNTSNKVETPLLTQETF